MTEPDADAQRRLRERQALGALARCALRLDDVVELRKAAVDLLVPVLDVDRATVKAAVDGGRAPRDGVLAEAAALLRCAELRYEHELRLQHAALHEPLTGLPNRALLVDRLEHALAVRRRTGQGVAVVFADLDDFKLVNDGLGHAAGDEALKEAGRRLVSAFREADTVARFGGDEFVVLAEAIERPEARDLMARACEELAEPYMLAGMGWRMTASLGMAIAADRDTPRTLLDAADADMYMAKRARAAAPAVERSRPRGLL